MRGVGEGAESAGKDVMVSGGFEAGGQGSVYRLKRGFYHS